MTPYDAAKLFAFSKELQLCCPALENYISGLSQENWETVIREVYEYIDLIMKRELRKKRFDRKTDKRK